MLILNVNGISKNFGYGPLLEDASFSLNERETISIVGPNGCGKSTLLKIIAGLEKADKGQVNIKKGAKVAYLDQTGSSKDDSRIVYDILKQSFGILFEMEEEINLLQKRMEDPSVDNYDEIVNRYCSLIESFSQEGGYEMDANINTVLTGLKIDPSILNKHYNDLSGGEKTLIQLAKALIIKPDLLLLDEPTNHLDIERIEWLEQYIKSFNGASVIVSHDRYFLDKMSTQILAIGDYGDTKAYHTNYSGYLVQREVEFQKQMAQYGDEQEAIKQLEAKAKQFMSLGMGRNSSALTKQGKTLWERAQRMREKAINKPKVQKKVNMTFQEENKFSNVIISVEDLTVVTPDNQTILNNISLEICAGERIALIGSNGSGKSTLIKTIMNDSELSSHGNIKIGPSVVIGYLPQIITFPDEKQTLLDYFRHATGLPEQNARQVLAGFKFYQEDVKKRVGSLSGGEKMKVKLAELLQNKINTLILDEPTNHIDIPTKEVLEDAIDAFSGTIIFVSHDRYFINKYANEIVAFDNGQIECHYGDYDYYKEKKNNVLKKKI